MDELWFPLFLAIWGVIYYINHRVDHRIIIRSVTQKDDVKKLPTCEAISSIQQILETNRVLQNHETIIHSLTLMLYHSRMEGQTPMVKMIPEDHMDISEIGREVIEKYNISCHDPVFFRFMAGVVELELEKIRLEGTIPYQDKQTIRKLVDVFYFKEI